jgi:hypothetical protein
MAWRIHEQVVRVIMDNRIPGIVTGNVWLAGYNDPLQLELVGNPWRDMAGCVLTLDNPHAIPDPFGGLATQQRGVCGDLTASRKVKIPTVPLMEWFDSHRDEPFPHVWGNGVYLEWFSERNGRVVIELSGIAVKLSEPAWRMTPEQEQEQRRHNSEALSQFMCHLIAASADSTVDDSSADRELEQRIRIESLKERVRDRAGGKMLCGGDENVPLDVLEQFWQNVLEFEEAPFPERPIRELLVEDGVYPPPSTGLTDEEIEAHLERLIEALERRGLLLCQTNHLSDRELYTLLVERVLDEETEAFPIDSGWFTHLEMSRYGAPDGEDAVSVYLRYYADDIEREQWHRDFPNHPMPPHEDPPGDRDHRLP